jgi:hypothetical protein
MLLVNKNNMRNKYIVLMDGDVTLSWITCMLRDIVSWVLLYIVIYIYIHETCIYVIIYKHVMSRAGSVRACSQWTQTQGRRRYHVARSCTSSRELHEASAVLIHLHHQLSHRDDSGPCTIAEHKKYFKKYHQTKAPGRKAPGIRVTRNTRDPRDVAQHVDACTACTPPSRTRSRTHWWLARFNPCPE